MAQVNANASQLAQFALQKLGVKSIAENTAQKIGIDKDKFIEADISENNMLDEKELIDFIEDDSQLFNEINAMYKESLEDKDKAKDKEAEKEEQTKVKDKNGAGV